MSAPRRRRWPWLLLLFVVASVGVAAVVYVRWESFADRAKEAHQRAEANVDALVDRLDLEESARTSGRAVDRIRGFGQGGGNRPAPHDGRVIVELLSPVGGDDLSTRVLFAEVIRDVGYRFVGENCEEGWASAVIANLGGEAISVLLAGDGAIVLETGTNLDHEQYSVDDFKFRPNGVIVSKNDRTFEQEGSVDVFDFSQSERGCWASGR